LEFDQNAVARGFRAARNNQWFIDIGLQNWEKNFRFANVGEDCRIAIRKMGVRAGAKLRGIGKGKMRDAGVFIGVNESNKKTFGIGICDCEGTGGTVEKTNVGTNGDDGRLINAVDLSAKEGEE
jgi:hypothetical protein